MTASKATLDEDQDLDKQFKSKLAIDTERREHPKGRTVKSDASKPLKPAVDTERIRNAEGGTVKSDASKPLKPAVDTERIRNPEGGTAKSHASKAFKPAVDTDRIRNAEGGKVKSDTSKALKPVVDTERRGNAKGGTVKSEDFKARLNNRIPRKINIQHKEDTADDCFITGIVLLTDTRLALADHANESVKIVDLRSDTIISYIKVGGRLNDITNVDANTLVAVMDKRLAFIHCNKLTQLGKQIKLDDRCVGISYCQNKLFVSFAGDTKHCVKVLNMDGKVIQTFKTDSQGRDLFHSPRYIAVSKDGETIFVSNNSLGNVTCLASDGSVKGVYKHVDLSGPTGVAVVGNTCYVAGMLSSNVHQITSQGKFMRIAYDSGNGLDMLWALAIDPTCNILYLYCNGDTFVDVIACD